MTSTCLCFAMLLAGAQAPQAPAPAGPPPATAVIRGHVIAGDTGQPLRKAQVRLNQIEAQSGTATATGRENRTVTTDADGKYEFKDLPGGRYNISASKGAYINMSWGQQQANTPGKPIDLHAGETLDRVDFTLPRGGVIAGRVVDELGEPLSSLQIGALRAQTINGKRQLMQVGYGSTDDLGEFRMFGLTPGQYYVQAVWRRMGPGDPTSPDRSGYPVTFFPGTTNEAEAQRFTVAAGQTTSDLAMALSPIKTARVEGTVVDVDGRPMGNTFLEVQQSISNNNFISGQSVRPDGTFTFASLAPGDYVLRTQPTTARKDVAMMKLTVGSDDITDLRLVALPPAIVSGRIVIDPSMSPPTAAFSLMAMPEVQLMPGGMQPARVADDLSFELTAMPGRNRITVLSLPPGWAMRSVRVNSIRRDRRRDRREAGRAGHRRRRGADEQNRHGLRARHEHRRRTGEGLHARDLRGGQQALETERTVSANRAAGPGRPLQGVRNRAGRLLHHRARQARDRPVDGPGFPRTRSVEGEHLHDHGRRDENTRPEADCETRGVKRRYSKEVAAPVEHVGLT